MGLFAVLKGEEPNFLLKLFLQKNAGSYGEYLLRFALKPKNLKGTFIVLHNLYLPCNDSITEVDLVLLHEKGVFVFESKNYRGIISGETNHTYWTQTLGKRKRVSFYNPLLQNHTHIRAVAKALHIRQRDCISCIVFSHRSKLKDVPKSDDNCLILRRDHLLKRLRKLLRRREVLYSAEELEQMAKALKRTSKNSYFNRQKHIQYVQSLRSPTVCPLCGGPLQKRSGQYGLFLGCENFPKCRYTHPIN